MEMFWGVTESGRCVIIKDGNWSVLADADDNANFRGTAWGVINAYTDFITHKVPTGNSATKDEGKFMTVTFNPAAMNAILNALALVR